METQQDNLSAIDYDNVRRTADSVERVKARLRVWYHHHKKEFPLVDVLKVTDKHPRGLWIKDHMPFSQFCEMYLGDFDTEVKYKINGRWIKQN